VKNLRAPTFPPLFEKFLLCTLSITIVSSTQLLETLAVNIECIVASVYCSHNPTNQGAHAITVEILCIPGRISGNDNVGDLFEILQLFMLCLVCLAFQIKSCFAFSNMPPRRKREEGAKR